MLTSCKEISQDQIKLKVNTSLDKIESIVEKKNIKTSKNKITKNNIEKIYYFLEDTYFIEGVKYTPRENYNYSEIGISTFYGKELHNVKTINNDLNKVTDLLGRHKTLPIPSMVKITNLDNGLSINIKIVDRHKDNAALIQVSRKVAQLLGFYKDKVATVKVDILPDASKQWKNVLISLNEPEFDKTISSAPTEKVSISEINSDFENIDSNIENSSDPIELLSEEINDYNLFLKVYNFKNYNDVNIVINTLNTDIKYTTENNGSDYNIIIGPLDKFEINNLVSYFISKGYKDTEIIIK